MMVALILIVPLIFNQGFFNFKFYILDENLQKKKKIFDRPKFNEYCFFLAVTPL